MSEQAPMTPDAALDAAVAVARQHDLADPASCEALRKAIREYGLAELRVLPCERWGHGDYTCHARLSRGEGLFGNEPCERCRRIAELEAEVVTTLR